MAAPHPEVTREVLAIDVGATSIKFCRVDGAGRLLETPKRRPTPYPCPPPRLEGILVSRIRQSGCARVGVGFPGEFADGHVVRPGNLSRPGGVTTDVDPDLAAQWIGFALQDALRDATDLDVRVVNDATLAALGCCSGVGTELVMTLGTGVGLALERAGELVRVRDVGAAQFRDGRTYDQSLGERARADDPTRWFTLVEEAVRGFVDEFAATTVHLAGGNAKRVSPSRFADLGCEVVVSGNEASLRGAARLFYP
jgi:polyphosphate glucokinase